MTASEDNINELQNKIRYIIKSEKQNQSNSLEKNNVNNDNYQNITNDNEKVWLF